MDIYTTVVFLAEGCVWGVGAEGMLSWGMTSCWRSAEKPERGGNQAGLLCSHQKI